MPSKLKATIKFGYEDSMKEWLDSNGQDFDSWITGPLTHAQAIYRHKSLGTEVEFEVRTRITGNTCKQKHNRKIRYIILYNTKSFISKCMCTWG